MRGTIYPDRASADRALAALDAAAGLPRAHDESEYQIPSPGNAAARLRARGIRTEHAVELVESADGRAALLDGVGGDDLPPTWLRPSHP